MNETSARQDDVMIDATQSNLRIPDPEAAQLFATAWTRALRSMTQISDLPLADTPLARCLRTIAANLRPSLVVPEPISDFPPWATPGVVAELLREAAAQIGEHGWEHNKKLNAKPGPVAHQILRDIDLAGYVSAQTGVAVKQINTSYIGYWEAGQCLELHVDSPKFGDINLLLCLEHLGADPQRPSSTAFVLPSGITLRCLNAGQCLIFDGTFAPHGRTQVAEGERVTLVNFGFRAG